MDTIDSLTSAIRRVQTGIDALQAGGLNVQIADRDQAAVPPPPEPLGPPESLGPTHQPARRGRPPGSRNKSTILREQEESNTAELRRLAQQSMRASALPTAPIPVPETEFRPDRVEGWEDEAPPDEDWRAAFDESMTLDPAVQVAGEEDADLPQKVRDRMKLIPDKVKAEVRRAHHAMGHMCRDSFLRMAKNANKSEDHLFYIRHWRCPVCLREEDTIQHRLVCSRAPGSQ